MSVKNRSGITRAMCITGIVILLAFVFSCPICFADVITTAEEAGPAEYIYVAGNPDLYLVEYYDKESETYKGLMPELLSKVSEITGLSFAYVDAGQKNNQLELARNNQVEIVTSFSKGSFNNKAVPNQVPVFTATIDGKQCDICIGFTAIASEELQNEIISAFESIPDSEKANAAISHSINNRPDEKNTTWIFVFIAALIAAIVTATAVHFYKRKKIEKIKMNAMTDELTGLGDSRYFFYSIEYLIAEQLRDLYYIAYISFAGSKEEKTLSEQEVIEVQKIVGQHLKTGLAAGEYAFRISEGTFAFVYQSSSKETAKARIGEIVKPLEGFAAGICSFAENPGCDGRFLLESAKQGYMYAVDHKFSIAFSQKKLVNKRIADDRLKQSIGKAIDNREFQIYMQFITDKTTEKICGAEMLSRWDNPERGLLRPDSYIEIMQNTGAITKHDYYIFENLCLLLEHWETTEYKELFLTCNFTRFSLSEKDFADKIKVISDKYNFEHKKLVIEMTEDSIAKDSRMVAHNIEKCRGMGFKIAIDDMGRGFSSIADLYGSEIDLVKIERNIVIAGTDEKGFRLLNGIISLAHNMNAKVLCEGVETEEQRKMVQNTECDYIQGYYYSRTLPYDEAMEFLSSQKHY